MGRYRKEAKRPMILGITGRVGTGKSTAAAYIQTHYSVWCIDMDKVGHQILEQKGVKEKIAKQFGKDMIEDQKINRKKLGERVFADSVALKHLNDIVHPVMFEEIVRLIQVSKGDGIIVGALLAELKLESWCHKILNLDATDEILEQRVGEKFTKIAPHQRSREAYQQSATFTLTNTYTPEFFHHLSSLLKQNSIFI